MIARKLQNRVYDGKYSKIVIIKEKFIEGAVGIK